MALVLQDEADGLERPGVLVGHQVEPGDVGRLGDGQVTSGRVAGGWVTGRGGLLPARAQQQDGDQDG
ncbi:hypothetical protein GCM10027586_05560 [Kineococcus gypseus]